MKRYGYLFEKAFSKENISLAIQKASKGKKDRINVIKILADKDKYVDKIYDLVWSGKYVPAPYTHAKIKDGVSKKERELCKPKFYPDHIVEWCIYLVLEPILKKSMIKNTYASLKGRGQNYGKLKVKKKAKTKNGRFYYKCDIRKFYPSVDNGLLIEMLERKIKDSKLMKMIKDILALEKGLPIGMILSQLFSNFFMNDVDHLMESMNYCRYADDIVIFGKASEVVHKARKILENAISKKRLTIKPTWIVYKLKNTPLDFMGFRFYRDHITIRKSIMYRATKRVRKWVKNQTLKIAHAITSYMGWIKNTNSFKFYENRIKPYVDFKLLKDIIRNGEKKNENLCFGI